MVTKAQDLLWSKHERSVGSTFKNQGHSRSTTKGRNIFYGAGKQKQCCLRKIHSKRQQQRSLRCERVSSGFCIPPGRALLQEPCHGIDESVRQSTEQQSETCKSRELESPLLEPRFGISLPVKQVVLKNIKRASTLQSESQIYSPSRISPLAEKHWLQGGLVLERVGFLVCFFTILSHTRVHSVEQAITIYQIM